MENKKTNELTLKTNVNPNSRLGTTIIDELRLCYVAKSSLLAKLEKIPIGESIDIGQSSLFRIKGSNFHYSFQVRSDSYKHVANLYFGRKGDVDNNFVWYKILNEQLYDSKALSYSLSIPDELGLVFNNFTALDLCCDFKKSIVTIIRRLYQDKSITTIVNGKAIKNRKKVIPELRVMHSVTLDRLKNPTFYAKQHKALHDKTKGICVYSYNKKSEIESSSKKQYILDYYNNPKSLHRLEVHLNSAEIRDYCTRKKLSQNLDFIFNKDLLTDMFLYNLQSVIRFSKNRKKIDWKDILNMCSGRAI